MILNANTNIYWSSEMIDRVFDNNQYLLIFLIRLDYSL